MQQLTFVTLSRDLKSQMDTRDAVVSSARSRLLAECDSPDDLLADVIRLRPAAALIVLAPGNDEKEFALIKQLVSPCPQTAIISAAADASPAIILASLG